MSKLNKLAGGYKGGNNTNTPKPNPLISESAKRDIDILSFIDVVKNRYIDNMYPKEDLECYIQCLRELKEGLNPTTLPKSGMLNPMIPFTKYMLNSNKIDNNHLDTQIEKFQDIIDNSTPKIIDPKLPQKTEGKLNILSRGYKK